jgi:hypothetical protein
LPDGERPGRNAGEAGIVFIAGESFMGVGDCGRAVRPEFVSKPIRTGARRAGSSGAG